MNHITPAALDAAADYLDNHEDARAHDDDWDWDFGYAKAIQNLRDLAASVEEAAQDIAALTHEDYDIDGEEDK